MHSHRASRTEHAQPPSRAEQTLRSVRLLGVTHKYTPTRIPARFMCATHMLSQSEASNARAGRGSMAGHSGVTLRRHSLANQKPGMRGGAFRSANTAERKQPCCSVQFGRAEPEQPIGLLSRTKPSPSDRVTPPSKPNRACKPPSRARADPPLGLLGLIPGLGADGAMEARGTVDAERSDTGVDR